MNNMYELIERLVNSPIDEDQTRSATNIGRSVRDTFEENENTIRDTFEEIMTTAKDMKKKKLN